MRFAAVVTVGMLAACTVESEKFDEPDSGGPMPMSMSMAMVTAVEPTTGSPPPSTTTTEGSEAGPQETTEPDTDSDVPPDVCGDGVMNPGEACDDGNGDNTDGCLDTCVEAVCGDGFVFVDGEDCDDGNADNTDACLSTCEAASCGDGFEQAGVEACDDGNDEPYDGCDDTCQPSVGMHVFVTSTAYTGDLNGLDGADAKCQNHAQDGDLPGNYKAWLSDNTIAARDRIVHSNDRPYVLADGQRVADDWAGLTSGALKLAIDRDEFGEPAQDSLGPCGGGLAYTNTKADGSTFNTVYDCNNWSMTMGPSAFGKIEATDDAWSLGCMQMGMNTCSTLAPLYCVQEPM